MPITLGMYPPRQIVVVVTGGAVTGGAVTGDGVTDSALVGCVTVGTGAAVVDTGVGVGVVDTGTVVVGATGVVTTADTLRTLFVG